MLDKVIVGRYIDTGSWVHRIDARAKITAMTIYLIVILLIDSFAEAAMTAAFSALLMAASRIRPVYFVRAVKPLLAVVAFIALFHIAFDSSGAQYFSLGFITFHAGGLERGLLAAFRMVLFIAFTAILTFTTPPAVLAQALESMMRPLEKLGLSPRKLSLMIGIALRFIPTVFEEADKIRKAQASRGMDLADLPLGRKARLLVSLLVPVTVASFRRALELAESMEARGYKLTGMRSRFHELVWSGRDTAFVAAVALLAAVLVLFGR